MMARQCLQVGEHVPAVHIDYPRHCVLLTAVSAALVLTERWLPILATAPSLGVYGALHASMLVGCLRPRQTTWRLAAFVLLASAMAMLNFAVAGAVTHAIAAAPGRQALTSLLTLASGLGAASYGVLIRRLWIPDLAPSAVAWITLGCVASTLMAVPVASCLHTIGGWWFAIVWWWTFSLMLWYHGGRAVRRRCNQIGAGRRPLM